MGGGTVTRHTLLGTAAFAASALATPFVRGAGSEKVVTTGNMVLGWHTNIAPRWLDPQQHDGGATPDNFLNVAQDALIKNFRDELYDHLALAEHFEFAEDAKSATFRLRPGLKFHNGAAVTPEDVKWSYEHYHGAWAKVLQDKTDGVEVLDEHTLRLGFKDRSSISRG
jgi:ABC-type transport system substrate-binding protein